MNVFDVKVYHFINQFAGHHHYIDLFMKFIAKDALEIYAVLFIIAWLFLPKHEEEKRHALVVAFFAGVLALLIDAIISHIWYRPRPFKVLPQGTFTQLIPHSADASFPSEHTSGSFAFAAGTWGTKLKFIRYCFTILAILTMISRVYVGVHWPTDVIGGLVVGVIAGKVMRKFGWGLLQPLTRILLRIFHYGRYSRRR